MNSKIMRDLTSVLLATVRGVIGTAVLLYMRASTFPTRL